MNLLKKIPRFYKILLEILFFIVLFLGIRTYMQHGTAEGPAPPLSGQFLDGRAVELQSMRGEPVLVFFWASWCGVCKMMLSSVAGVAEDYQVISVAMQSGTAGELADYLREKGLALPVIPDPSGALARRYGVRGVPSSFVIDPEGRIRFVEVGYTSGFGLRSRLYLAKVW